VYRSCLAFLIWSSNNALAPYARFAVAGDGGVTQTLMPTILFVVNDPNKLANKPIDGTAHSAFSSSHGVSFPRPSWAAFALNVFSSSQAARALSIHRWSTFQ